MAIGFVTYAVVTVWAVIRVKEPPLVPASAAPGAVADPGKARQPRAAMRALFFASR